MPSTVVLVVLDSLRYDIFYDYLQERKSPFLSDFRDMSVEFHGATAAAPWSLPSHASMFTGKYPREHGALRFNTRITSKGPTLTEQLANHGYTTACFSANGFVKAEYGFNGWDYQPDHYGKALFADANSPRSDKAGGKRIIDALGQVAQSDKPFKSFINALHSQARRTPALIDDGGKAITNDAIRWVGNRSDEEDIFLFCNFMETHVMHKKLSSLWERFWNIKNMRQLSALESELHRKDYHPDGPMLSEEAIRLFKTIVADELYYVDHLLNELYGQLCNAGRDDDCLFLLCADHGDGLGEYGFVYHDFGGLTEPLVRVPLLVSSTGVDPAVIDQRVSLSWIYSTVLDFVDQHSGPILTDSTSYPELVGTETTRHVLSAVDSPKQIHNYYLKDRLAVYQTAKPEQKYVRVGNDHIARQIERRGLDESDDGPYGEEVIDAFKSEYKSTTVEQFELEAGTESRLRDLGYI